MADQVARVIVKVTVEMAHEQVLKLRCEYYAAMVVLYTALRFNRWRGRYGAVMAARAALNSKRQLRRIARWV